MTEAAAEGAASEGEAAQHEPAAATEEAMTAEDEAALDWADLVAGTPEPDAAQEEAPALGFAAIEALSPEQRLALFA
ncbi:hypothetical protein ACU4GR_33375 [Methylobacterium oryzae CBMB20]